MCKVQKKITLVSTHPSKKELYNLVPVISENIVLEFGLKKD